MDIEVEVAYALPEKQKIYRILVELGTTVGQAVKSVPIQEDFPSAEIENSKTGIFGKLVPESWVLRAGDRVEVYRPLLADPKEVRKRRAAADKGQGKRRGS